MSNVARQIRDATPDRAAITLLDAEFTESASSVDNRLEIIIPVKDPNRSWGPYGWPTRVDDSGSPIYPNSGDPCVVGLAETEDPGMPRIWILAWEPS